MGNLTNNTELAPQNYILIGPQGSGKGTQSQTLINKYNLQYLGTGDLLRKISAIPTPLGQKIKSIIESGNLLPDELLMEVVHNELQTVDRSKGLLFDGIPRTLSQAEILDKIISESNLTIPKAIYIHINRDIAIDRLTNRRTCDKCQMPYLPNDPSAISGICAKCGGKVETRVDDNKEAIEKRLELYYKETEPILDYYYNSYRLVKINGDQPIDKVSEDLIKVFEQK